MKRYFLLAVIVVSVSAMLNRATAQNTLSSTTEEKLPDGVMVQDGKLKLKEGYVAIVAKDKKSVQVKNISSKSVTGTFICGCENASCSVTTVGTTIFCSGTCECALITTINGIKYMVNLRSGGMQRKAGQ